VQSLILGGRGNRRKGENNTLETNTKTLETEISRDEVENYNYNQQKDFQNSSE
jgi:hypothetical protein